MATTRHVILIGLTIGAIGCGSSESRRSASDAAGAAGWEEIGGEAGAGATGTDTTGGNNPGTGGSNTGGLVDIGGAGGNELVDIGGAGGNEPATGGSATGGNDTGGSAGSATGGWSGTCIPKTCETIAADLAGWTSDSTDPFPEACGVVGDGCGGYKDCGGCSNPNQACGYGNPTGYWVFDRLSGTDQIETDNPIPGVCGGGCIGISGSCTLNDNTSGHVWGCMTDAPPVWIDICERIDSYSSYDAYVWCCRDA